MLLANFNGKEHLRHRAVSLREHGFLVLYIIIYGTHAIPRLCLLFLSYSRFFTNWHLIVIHLCPTLCLQYIWSGAPSLNYCKKTIFKNKNMEKFRISGYKMYSRNDTCKLDQKITWCWFDDDHRPFDLTSGLPVTRLQCHMSTKFDASTPL